MLIGKSMNSKSCVIYCKCDAGIFTGREVNLTEALKKLQTDVYELHDLCAFTLNEKEFMENAGKEYSRKIIIACYSRTIQSLFIQNKINFGNFRVISLREEPDEKIVAELKEFSGFQEGKANYKVKVSGLKVPAWFPVIDTSRCNLCGQCARFCLFGVYQFNKKSLKVVNPLSCKNNCPACGRKCPAFAIIFPKIPENSVLAGAEPGKPEQNISSDTNPDLLEQLKKRNRDRKSIFREEVVLRAEEERRRALDSLNKQERKESL